ncbi:putative membrane protein [Phytomonospora endophytica]|uniref:Putative membrane protein n=1 Tax=Phytomonospora endophytica TaxID=714109 RepID=A0A841F6N5_9ACTN|nr:putative membrane protein [Phytomonospora endophytica]
MRRNAGFAALVVAAITYLTWIFGEALNPALDPLTSYVSELAADDQPHEWFFRIGDVVTGSIAGTVAILRVKGSHGARFAGWVGVIVFGVATLLDAGPFTLTCAPSIDSDCKAAEQAGTLPFPDDVHTVASVIATVALVVAAVAFALYSGSVLRWALAGLVTATSLAVAITVLAGADIGLAQRIQLLSFSAWLVALGWWQRCERTLSSSPASATGRSAGPASCRPTPSYSTASGTPARSPSTARPPGSPAPRRARPSSSPTPWPPATPRPTRGSTPSPVSSSSTPPMRTRPAPERPASPTGPPG